MPQNRRIIYIEKSENVCLKLSSIITQSMPKRKEEDFSVVTTSTFGQALTLPRGYRVAMK